mgnify:CR=1 FL=1
MGTCETGVLRCFDARHEASMWSEWLYTYMYSVYQGTCFGVCVSGCASVWRKAGARLHSGYSHEPAQECRRRHAADVPTGPMRKEIPAPGLPERGDAAGIYVVLDVSSTRWSVWSMSMRHVPPWSRFCSAYSWRPFLRSIASSFSMINRLLFGDLMRREHDVHGRLVRRGCV